MDLPHLHKRPDILDLLMDIVFAYIDDLFRFHVHRIDNIIPRLLAPSFYNRSGNASMNQR